MAQRLPTLLRVRVTESGKPARDVVVHWHADAGSLSDTLSSTDANGLASAQWTLGTVAGTQHTVASVDAASPVSFTVLALPGTPVGLTITPNNVTLEPDSTMQLTAAGTDLYGNQLLASQVMWTSTVAAVASISPMGLVTGARAGTARVRATVDTVVRETSVTVPAHWRAIAAGQRHTCALDELGYAFCWGANDEAQLGVTGIDSSSVPVPVSTTLRFTALVVGRDHACGLTANQRAYCWGRNGEGQLGTGSVQPGTSAVPVPVTGNLTLLSIAANDGLHTCALTVNHAAMCWGWESEGELGNGMFLTFTPQPTPQVVLGSLTFDTLMTGQSHTCGLSPTGAAYCWGNGYSGQVGDSSQPASPYRPAPVAVVGGLQFKSMAAGASHTCALTSSGATYCWGLNDVGQIGDGNVGGNVLSPVPVQTALVFGDIASSEYTNCALTTTGESYCWGSNAAGQIGDSTTTNRDTPTPTQTAAAFTRITVGWIHTCAITASGTGYCWGANDQGQLGTGTSAAQLVPSPVIAPR